MWFINFFKLHITKDKRKIGTSYWQPPMWLQARKVDHRPDIYLKEIYQKTWEFDREIHVLFIDFKKAYDSIHRESLINILREFHFGYKLIKLIEISILETFVKVRGGNIITDPI